MMAKNWLWEVFLQLLARLLLKKAENYTRFFTFKGRLYSFQLYWHEPVDEMIARVLVDRSINEVLPQQD